MIKGGPVQDIRFGLWICAILGLCILPVAESCSHIRTGRIVLLGSTSGNTGPFYLMEQNTFDLMLIDSVTPDADGRFRIDITAEQTSIYALRETNGDQAVFIASPGDTVRISGNQGLSQPALRVSGTWESELLQAFSDFSAGNLRKVDSLQILIDMSQGEDGFYELTVKADSMFIRIWEAQRQYEMNFIKNYPGTFASLLVVNYHFGVKPVLSPDADWYYYHVVDSGLMAAYGENRHTQFFHRWLKEVGPSPGK